jgi:hypothetical protein
VYSFYCIIYKEQSLLPVKHILKQAAILPSIV